MFVLNFDPRDSRLKGLQGRGYARFTER